MSRTMLVEYLGGTWPVLPLNIPRMLRYEPLWTTKTATQRIIRRRDLLTPDLKLHNNTSSAISPDGRRPFPEAGIRYARTAYSHYGKSSNHCQTHLTDYKTNADSPFCWTPHFLPQNRHFTPSPARHPSIIHWISRTFLHFYCWTKGVSIWTQARTKTPHRQHRTNPYLRRYSQSKRDITIWLKFPHRCCNLNYFLIISHRI